MYTQKNWFCLIIYTSHHKNLYLGEKMKRNPLITLIIVLAIISLSVFSAVLSRQKPESQEELIYQTLTPAKEALATVNTPTTAPVLPTPTLQSRGEITFEYKLTEVLPEEFFGGTYVKNEKLSFYREGPSWPIKNSSLKLLNLGQLYQIYRYDDLSNKIGNCGINTYPEDENTFPIQFQPVAEVCKNIVKNETATITFGLANCDVDLSKTIYCQQSYETGTLKYRLNHNLDKFQFLYTGEWNYDYPAWINLALIQLGFLETPDTFFDNMTPGANYTIYKTSP